MYSRCCESWKVSNYLKNMHKTCEECEEEVQESEIGFEMNDLCICNKCFHPVQMDDYEDFLNLFDMR